MKRKKNGIIILMFHKVNSNYDPLPLTINENIFENIVRELKKGQKIISIDEINNNYDEALEKNGIKFVLTFDDGYKDNYTNAFPVLKKYSVPATIYLSIEHVDGKRIFWYEKLAHAILFSKSDVIDITDLGVPHLVLGGTKQRLNVLNTLNDKLKDLQDENRNIIVDSILERSGSKNTFKSSEMLDWDMIRKMSESHINFGSHTLTHPILSRESPDRISHEISLSKQIIENRLNSSVSTFAYPNGTETDFNNVVVKEVIKAGYCNACTTIEGINTNINNRFLLKRINIHNNMCMTPWSTFSKRLFWIKVLGIL